MFASIESIQSLVEQEVANGIDREKIVIGGFSQGASFSLVLDNCRIRTDPLSLPTSARWYSIASDGIDKREEARRSSGTFWVPRDDTPGQDQTSAFSDLFFLFLSRNRKAHPFHLDSSSRLTPPPRQCLSLTELEIKSSVTTKPRIRSNTLRMNWE